MSVPDGIFSGPLMILSLCIDESHRFFAAMELKAMLAHILVNYDVKAETEGVRPPDLCFGLLRMPNAKGKIWIRKRQ
jgi:hypothetical protein